MSSKFALARFRPKPVAITVVCVYAPTLITDTDVKDAFFDELQKAVDGIPKRDLLIITVDWNARTGQDDAGTSHLIGKFGLGQRCGNGERLLNFAAYN